MGPHFFENLSNVATSLAACGGLYIAWMGLNTWKEQIKWQNDFDLSRRILLAIYQFRDAVAAARSPFMWADEMRQDDGTPLTGRETANERHAGTDRAHRRRWEPISKHNSEVYALLLEAEAVWGREPKELWLAVQKLQNELLAETEMLVEANSPDNIRSDNFYPTKEDRVKSRQIVYSNKIGDQENEFTERLQSAFEKVEDFVRAKMGPKPK